MLSKFIILSFYNFQKSKNMGVSLVKNVKAISELLQSVSSDQVLTLSHLHRLTPIIFTHNNVKITPMSLTPSLLISLLEEGKRR